MYMTNINTLQFLRKWHSFAKTSDAKQNIKLRVSKGNNYKKNMYSVLGIDINHLMYMQLEIWIKSKKEWDIHAIKALNYVLL